MNLRRSVVTLLGLSIALNTEASGLVQAQQQTQTSAGRGSITGVVKDATSGLPLSLVNVQIPGSSIGAATNAEGRYTIANVQPGIVNLRFTRVGYAPTDVGNLRVAAGAPTIRDVTMSVSVLTLSNVVATGLSDPASGTRAPFSIARVGAERLEVAPTGSPLEALSGKVAGLQIRGGTLPGSDVVIQIRNPLSITGFTQPLIIVDGVIQIQDDPSVGARAINGNPLDISPENIETIEVVRGAAAAALYGQRAANGVINITTKRGTDVAVGQTRMTFTNEGGITKVARTLPFTQSHQFLMNENNEFVDAAGRPIQSISSDFLVISPDRMMDKPWPVPIYDNVAALFKTGYSLRNTLALSQNSLATNFNISGNSTRESGVIRESGGEARQGLNMTIDYRAGNKLNLGLGMNYGRTYVSNLAINADATGGGNDNAFLNAQNICKCVSILTRDPATGEYLHHPDGGGNIDQAASGANPLFIESNRDEWDRRVGLQVNGSSTFRPTSVFSLSAQGGYNRSDREEQLEFLPVGTILTDGDLEEAGTYDVAQSMDETFNGLLRLNMLTGMGGWTIRATAGTGGTFAKRNALRVTTDSLLQNQPDFDYGVRTEASTNYRETRSIDYTANVAIDFNQKYNVDIVYRAEGNSLLPPETRWRSNGRASASWVVSEEPWWPLPDFSLFKPRYSIGTAGNNPRFEARYELYNQLTGTGVTRITKINLGNENIRPEQVTEQEFGIDMAWRNRYSMSLSYVRNTVVDQIRPDTIVAFTGFDTQQVNLGDLQGDSYEATMEAQWIQTRNVQFSSTLVLDRARQKITKYPRLCNTSIGNTNTTNSTYQRYCEGYVFGNMFGRYHVTNLNELSPIHHTSGTINTHFDRNDEGYIVAVGPNGSYTDGRWGQILEIDGIDYEFGLPIGASTFTSEGFPNGHASKVIAQGLPDFSFGFGNQVRVGDWALSAQTLGQVGGKIFNQARQRGLNRDNPAELDQRGKPDYLKKTIDYYTQGMDCCDPDEGNSGGLTGGGVLGYPHFMESGTFLKLSELRLSYRLNEGLPVLRRLGMTGGSIALVGRDLFTITNYTGYDPQVSGTTAATTARIDRATAPNYRSVSAQLRVFF